MSESMAFIGGVAVAGLAALLLLKGTGNSLQPNILPSQVSSVVAPQPVVPPPQYPYGQPVYPNPPAPSGPTTEERVAMERLKMENEAFKKENDQLKTQIQQIQFQYQAQVNAINAQNAQNNQPIPVKPTLQPEQSPWWSSPIAWAVGGMTLTIGGGVVVAGVLALFGPKQQRPTRTVQVIHPYNGPTPPLAPVRRAEFLPPRGVVRRADAEYEDTY
ncbi:heterocyst differentiation related protein [Aetokthonos hydrillicola Thurmond2011]|jgi:hypothetical protein|uniref:Heterocyst differentiation related protein n=1 Tax=Aetokthonos hydrillicola Thurmond2011 TaxID=2712845 RepID=A0AAP5I6J9_9CYAN|nr:heterocyst differentiation related protein [Aetokthonos hydrillicola]MBO3461648.1 heterocyst differentiation related protein [Aetokthonos hydrillicola CCALA 1050]MBW4588739.1 heterocyst differentiation related protein [Aetokthonos hydrillicola CCALA 1050]MDR9895927.1 heterocyst differentiation related protein [Aetokthonos hydrillicola Thurmond2011]